MSTRITLLCVVMLMAGTLAAQAGNLPYATDRAPLRVTRTGSAVTVEAYEWVATHDLGAGGCATSRGSPRRSPSRTSTATGGSTCAMS